MSKQSRNIADGTGSSSHVLRAAFKQTAFIYCSDTASKLDNKLPLNVLSTIGEGEATVESSFLRIVAK